MERGVVTAEEMGKFGKSLEHMPCYKVDAHTALVFSCEITEIR